MLLVKHGASIFCVPSDLVSQLRQINDITKAKKSKHKQNGSGTKSGQSSGIPVPAPMACKVTCNSLVVSAPQLGFPEVVLPIGAGTTAGDIVLS